MKEQLLARLEAAGQSHLLAFWDQLESEAQRRLKQQIDDIDFELIDGLYRSAEQATDWASVAAKAKSPMAFRLNDAADFAAEARQRGEAALRAGKLGAILVAGGQGTRLGFPHPKGMFPLGPVSKRTIFQILIEKLRAVSQRYGKRIPLYLMTSPTTHAETVDFLSEHDRFGLPEEDLIIFCQGTMPAVDAQTGKLLLSAKGELFLGPDGHGGMLAALDRGGCLADAAERGIEQLFFGQIDNPLVQLCDPQLIGYHLMSGSEMTTQVVEKTGPEERVGNVVSIDGKTSIIEYSDLPDDAARQCTEDGSLRLWAGNIAVHVFDMGFLNRAKDQADALPFHRALKKTPFVDASGELAEPETPNSIKFERFIFDLLPHAKNAVAVEAARVKAFAPVKNANEAKVDTPETARALMVDLHKSWLRSAGVQVDDGVAVEVGALFALDAKELAEKLQPPLCLTEDQVFD